MQELFVCTCGDTAHQFVIEAPDFNLNALTYNIEPDDIEIYLCVHLNHKLGFFSRLGVAFNYIFGKQCDFGAFNEVILDTDKVAKLINKLSHVYQQMLKYKASIPDESTTSEDYLAL